MVGFLQYILYVIGIWRMIWHQRSGALIYSHIAKILLFRIFTFTFTFSILSPMLDAELALKAMDKEGSGTLTKEEMHSLMKEHLSTQRSLWNVKKVSKSNLMYISYAAHSNVSHIHYTQHNPQQPCSACPCFIYQYIGFEFCSSHPC